MILGRFRPESGGEFNFNCYVDLKYGWEVSELASEVAFSCALQHASSRARSGGVLGPSVAGKQQEINDTQNLAVHWQLGILIFQVFG